MSKTSTTNNDANHTKTITTNDNTCKGTCDIHVTTISELDMNTKTIQNTNKRKTSNMINTNGHNARRLTTTHTNNNNHWATNKTH
jgi:hypothetical protein